MSKKVIIAIVLIILIVISTGLIFLRSSSGKPEREEDEFEEAVEQPEERDISSTEVKTDDDEHTEAEKEAKSKDEGWLDNIIEETPDPNVPPIKVNPEGSQETPTDFDAYTNMSADEQRAFYESFESPDAFFEWYNAAKAENDKNSGDIILDGNTNIEIKR